MSTADLERLRAIRTFPSLVKYLRDELDWPIESEDFDDLTFDWKPEELGIDQANAAKIEQIKQLRPLVTNQPWGIFFVKFEPKRLPVVALRRILSQLVIKKRASTRKAEQPSWHLNDLLFISNYGEGGQRQITFAQFTQNKVMGDLPALKVLGWDDADTVLHIDHVHQELKEKLHWPDNKTDAKGWQERWSSAFVLRHKEVITTSKELAIRLADLAVRIRRRTNQVLAIETERGPLRKLHKAFQTSLIHDLSHDDFADMYAQTISYGLLAARVSRPAGVTADILTSILPTNPFLKVMLGTFLSAGGRKGGIDFDELGIQEVVELLNSPGTHIGAILRDFGKRTRQEDPVINFYELFLAEYDRRKKVERGVFYTPQPVVSYIVRSVHEILQTEFGLEEGLASTITWGEIVRQNPAMKIPEGTSADEPFVMILDPAVGTATFHVEVIDLIYKTMTDKWRKQGMSDHQQNSTWNDYVAMHLLPRLYGFELMMAPYAIAHMKIGLKLYETGYRFGSNERAHIYLTNSLEPASQLADESASGLFGPLAHEARAVNAIKREKRYTVVIGNPPYSNFGQLNRNPFILSLLEAYKRGLDERKINIDDDFIKFIRLGQHVVEVSGSGILGFITNNTYIDGITHRRMRRSLMDCFPEIRICDLHGSLMKGERSPDNSADENVFDIKQGVAIGLFSCVSRGRTGRLLHSELWGTRDSKYAKLVASTLQHTHWGEVQVEAPNYFFAPKLLNFKEEYQVFHSVSEIFRESVSGIQTGRDSFVSAESIQLFDEKVAFLRNQKVSDEEVSRAYDLPDFASFDLTAFRRVIREKNGLKLCLKEWLYRPFDVRPIIYHHTVIKRMRGAIMKSLLRPNIALITVRQLARSGFAHVFATKHLGDGNTISLTTREYNYYFPLYIYSEGDQSTLSFHPTLNLSERFIQDLTRLLPLTMHLEEYGDLTKTVGPRDIFNYIYAVFHSCGYRRRYAELLKIDFPRLPLTAERHLFRSLCQLGDELVCIHLMESPKLNRYITKFIGRGSPVVEKVAHLAETVWIDKAGTQGFQRVPEAVWNFHIGGYQVCEKWLKDRKGRVLSSDDINHYQKIIVALNETIRIMGEIDKVIEARGGWPGAFITSRE